MKLFVSIAFFFCFYNFGYSQLNQPNNENYFFSGIFGISRAKFDVIGVSTEEYPSLELRLGGRLAKTLSSKVVIESGLNICFRARRKSYLINGNYYGKGVPILLLDETGSKRNHVALEIPLSIKILLDGGRSNINTGLMGRFWQPNDFPGDILRSQQEIGYVLGASRRIYSDLTLGIDFYWGINSLCPGLLIGPTRYCVKNRFAQLTFTYPFKERHAK